jgi:hypothetical protein
MGEDLRLRQGGMLSEHSVILPLKQNSESFLDRGDGSCPNLVWPLFCFVDNLKY